MNEENTQKLTKRFPQLFGKGGFYGECGDGWYRIIKKMCKRIVKISSKARIEQVKEKFGTLRVYTGLASEKGVAKQVSLESMSMRWQGVLGDAMTDMKRLYSKYSQSAKKVGTKPMSATEFGRAISKGIRDQRTTNIPALDEAIGLVKQKVMDRITTELRTQGLLDPRPADLEKAWKLYRKDQKAVGVTRDDILDLANFSQQVTKYARNSGKDGAYLITPKGRRIHSQRVMDGAKVAVIGAKGYIPRFYKFDLIMQRSGEFEDDLVKYMTDPATRESFGIDGEPLPLSEAIDVAKQVKNTILGYTRKGGIVPDDIVVKSGRLQERVVNIPDVHMERWLEQDIDQILERYMRELAPRIEAKRMGLDEIYINKMINREYDELEKDAMGDVAKLQALGKRRQLDIDNINHMFNQAMGTLESKVSPGGAAFMGVMRDLNFARLLGNVVPSSLGDLGRHVMLAGFGKPIGLALKRLSPEFRKMSEESLRSIGGASEIWLNNRIAGWLGDEVSMHNNVNWMRHYSNGITQKMGKWSGIQRWNHENKVLAGLLSQDAMINQIKKAAKSGKKADYDKLAKMGVSKENAAELAENFKDLKKTNGVWLANLHDFRDSSALHQFQSSILKDIERTIVTPGIGDKPKFMTTDLGATMLQFRSFQFGAINKMLLPLAQDPLAAKNLAGMLSMFFIGGAAAASKMYIAGRGDEWEAMSMQEQAREALDASGMLGVNMEIFNV